MTKGLQNLRKSKFVMLLKPGIFDLKEKRLKNLRKTKFVTLRQGILSRKIR